MASADHARTADPLGSIISLLLAFPTMPTPSAFAQHVTPAFYLYPLDDPFVPKYIAFSTCILSWGYKDNPVLQIYIKDVKSFNGTFIKDERLSGEGLESKPFKLKSNNIVEFGIDIVDEDNKTIIHDKVAPRVPCVLNEQDAQAAAHAEQQQLAQNPPGYTLSSHHQNMTSATGPSNTFNFNGQGPPVGGQRHPAMQPQGLVGMGGMGGSTRQPGKGGLTFDYILSCLQGELQESRDTGAELHSLNGSMAEIHNTLGGTMPANLLQYPQALPPVIPPRHTPEPPTSSIPPATIGELQSQLQENQNAFSSYTDQLHVLDSLIAEHDGFKHDTNLVYLYQLQFLSAFVIPPPVMNQ